MYDIQGALRRRAMAERLEALSRADEATRHAVDEADVPLPPPGPRHLAGWRPGEPPFLEPAPFDVVPSVPAASVDAPQMEGPHLEVAHLEVPPFEGTARRGAPDALPRGVAPLGVTPLEVPRADLRPVTPVEGDLPRRAVPTLPPPQPGAPITPAAGTPGTEPPTTDRFVARTPDRTNRYENPALRPEQADQPTGGGTDLSVPPGVTLLHDSLALPPRAPLSLGDGVIDLTVVEDRAASAAPAALRTGPDDVTTEAADPRGVMGVVDITTDDITTDDITTVDVTTDDVTTDDVTTDDVTTVDVTTEAADPRGVMGVVDVTDAAADDVDDSDLEGESSASAIADLLRHGGSKLFFKR